MKKNNKGFFLAEAIVMIALVTSVMAFVYPNVAKLYEEFNLQVSKYDQIQDIYVLKYIYEKDSDETDGSNVINDNTKGICNGTNDILGTKELKNELEPVNIGEVKFGGANVINLEMELKELYITNYMSLSFSSATDYNFKKYLNRMKKTNNDPSAYRLIGIFEKTIDEKTITRYASIKIDNPNPTRECNL